MTRSQRAAHLARLAWMASSGYLAVASIVPDINRDVVHILDTIGPQLDGEPKETRHRLACDLFASAAMSLAVALDPSGGHDEWPGPCES
jgi:hypothetical protein